MNPFTTIPRFIKLYFRIKTYNKNAPEFDKLRAAEDYEGERALIQKNTKIFCDGVGKDLGITLDVDGEENIPSEGTFMVYANHQSFADIFAILKLFSNHRQMGFIAKEEWKDVKVLAKGIDYTRSLFLKRGSGRDALKTIKESTDLLSKGFALTIFPEGTRSQCSKMNEFKLGSIQFAQRGKVPILPITLDGGYKLYEEKHTYQPCNIKVTVHPLVHIEEMGKHEAMEVFAQIEETVKSAL